MSIKKAIIILIIITIVGSITAYLMLNKKPGVTYNTAEAKKGVIIQTVSETGTLKSESEIDLSFLNTGNIEKINVEIGDKVQKGDILAELDYSSLVLSRDEAIANLEYNQKSLDKLIAGATQEEIDIAKASVSQAKTAHEAAQRELTKTKALQYEAIVQAEKELKDLELSTPNDTTTYEQAIKTAQTDLDNTKATYQNSIDDSIDSSLTSCDDKIIVARTALDTVNRIVTDEDADDLISRKNPLYLNLTNSSYNDAKDLLTEAEESYNQAMQSKTSAAVENAIDKTLELLNKTFETLQNCFTALENSITSTTFTLTELDTFKSNISAQETLISTAISTIQTREQALSDALLAYSTFVSTKEQALATAQTAYDKALTNALNALNTARLNADSLITAAESKVSATQEAWQVSQKKLNQTVAPTNKHDLALWEAKIKQASAALESINKKVEDSKIISPVNGIITKINNEVGEQVSSNIKVISILGDNNFEIEVLISEADIEKIKIKDKTEITLDAFGDDVKFRGEVFFIEPAETVIQDVIYYKVKISFDAKGKEIKSGMTANVIITTAQKDDVIQVPTRAVIDRNGDGKIVRILVSDKMEERQVEVGLRGDGGVTEIISGVNVGDLIITYIKEEK